VVSVVWTVGDDLATGNLRNAKCERVICETGCETRCDWSAEISIFRRLPCTTWACKLCNLRNRKRENTNVFTYTAVIYASVSCSRPILWCKRSSV